MFDSAKRVMSGSWGEVWLDSEYVAEAYGVQAKVALNKEKINVCRSIAEDTKVTGVKMTGSLKLHKVTSRMAILIGDSIKMGKDPRFTIISKLDDPDSYGAERLALYNVSFDDLTLADWEAAKNGTVECPFTFTNYEFLDKVEVQ